MPTTSDFPDTLGEIPSATFMALPVLDLHLAFGATDSNIDFDRNSLLSPLSSPFFYCC